MKFVGPTVKTDRNLIGPIKSTSFSDQMSEAQMFVFKSCKQRKQTWHRLANLFRNVHAKTNFTFICRNSTNIFRSDKYPFGPVKCCSSPDRMSYVQTIFALAKSEGVHQDLPDKIVNLVSLSELEAGS